ncbi:MAG: hypothetical protein WCT46_04625 [Candidatus Gracilibacteria bacterium]
MNDLNVGRSCNVISPVVRAGVFAVLLSLGGSGCAGDSVEQCACILNGGETKDGVDIRSIQNGNMGAAGYNLDTVTNEDRMEFCVGKAWGVDADHIDCERECVDDVDDPLSSAATPDRKICTWECDGGDRE